MAAIGPNQLLKSFGSGSLVREHLGQFDQADSHTVRFARCLLRYHGPCPAIALAGRAALVGHNRYALLRARRGTLRRMRPAREWKPSPRITHCVGAAFSFCRRSAPHSAQQDGSEHGGPCGLASYRIRALPPRVRRPCESFSLNMRAHQAGLSTITRIALVRSFAQVSTSPASISAGRSLRAQRVFPWPTCRGQPPAISRRAG